MVLFAVFVVLALIWVSAFLYVNDLHVPTDKKRTYKRVLILYPHPDDEVLSCGGYIGQLRAAGAQVTLATLTKGECGTPDAHTDVRLKHIRSAEAHAAAQILGVSRLIIEDFGDGKLEHKQSFLQKYVRSLMTEIQPDLVITYDLSGLYGHTDHVALSEAVTAVRARYFPDTALWYNTLPVRLLQLAKLPEHMAKDPKFRSRCLRPTHKVWVGWSWLAKAKAIRAYRSQFESFSSALPLPWLPVECFCSLLQFEYFAREK